MDSRSKSICEVELEKNRRIRSKPMKKSKRLSESNLSQKYKKRKSIFLQTDLPAVINIVDEDSPEQNILRAVDKHGVVHLGTAHADQQSQRLFFDIFTTLLELKWRWTFLLFALSYLASWTIFGIAYFAVSTFHGDFRHLDLNDTNWNYCIANVEHFTDSFLFSVETQHTIGYGNRSINNSCVASVIIFCIQAIFGTILEGFMVGMLFVKMTRSKKRSITLMFSKFGVICRRDGVKCFMFRIGDLRRSHLLETHVRALIVRKKTTLEGEVIDTNLEELKVNGSGEKGEKLLLFWPTTVVHEINRKSPLYNLSPDDKDFEIIVTLEGIVEYTGLCMQARTSYLPSEIQWGHRLSPMKIETKLHSGERLIDFSHFNDTVKVETF